MIFVMAGGGTGGHVIPAIAVAREVVRDGNWVSSRQPDDIVAFNQEMISAFAESAVQKAA